MRAANANDSHLHLWIRMILIYTWETFSNANDSHLPLDNHSHLSNFKIWLTLWQVCQITFSYNFISFRNKGNSFTLCQACQILFNYKVITRKLVPKLDKWEQVWNWFLLNITCQTLQAFIYILYSYLYNQMI